MCDMCVPVRPSCQSSSPEKQDNGRHRCVFNKDVGHGFRRLEPGRAVVWIPAKA